MKISVITRHAPANYGSLLQAIATQRVLEDMGYECEVIDYIPEGERGSEIANTTLKGKPEWNRNIMRRMLYLTVRQPENIIMDKKFERMRNRHLKMSIRYTSEEQIKKQKPIADVYLTGSDQVWGPISTEQYDPCYFLSFCGTGDKCISYASSFGKVDFTKETLKEYKNLLSRYHSITVRESSAVELLKKLGIKCRGQVLDPTLLLSAQDWDKYITKKIDFRYVLVYQIHYNKEFDDYAIRFSKYVGLPLIRVSSAFHQIVRGGKFKFLPNIDEFLSYIKNATYVITDSFHGTAFSINFEKQFIEILPTSTRTDTRNKSILQLTGLSNRVVVDYNDFQIANNNIEFKEVSNILDEHRKISKEMLKEIICN